MMNPATTFLCGMGGSIAIELVALYEAYQTEPFRLPERYSKFWFYVIRILLAMAAGGLAVAYEIDEPLLAVNVGVSAPLLLQTLARGLQHGGPNRGA